MRKRLNSHWMSLEIIGENPLILSLEWAGPYGQPSSFGKLVALYDPDEKAELVFLEQLSTVSKVREYHQHDIFRGLRNEDFAPVRQEYESSDLSCRGGRVKVLDAEISDVGSSAMVFRFLSQALFQILLNGLPETQEEFELIRQKAVSTVIEQSELRRRQQ